MKSTTVSEKPTRIIIFGASGDLTQRKLMPALFNLFCKHRLPAHFHIAGVGRTEMDDEGFCKEIRSGIDKFTDLQFNQSEWQEFAAHLTYHCGDATVATEATRLGGRLAAMEGEPADRLYYLATPPQFFGAIVTALGSAGMTKESEGFRRVVVEKPFGTDLKSAKRSTRNCIACWTSSRSIASTITWAKRRCRICLVFRFANTHFRADLEPQLCRSRADHRRRRGDVGHRGGYYDRAGVLRDMFQNHILAAGRVGGDGAARVIQCGCAAQRARQVA